MLVSRKTSCLRCFAPKNKSARAEFLIHHFPMPFDAILVKKVKNIRDIFSKFQ